MLFVDSFVLGLEVRSQAKTAKGAPEGVNPAKRGVKNLGALGVLARENGKAALNARGGGGKHAKTQSFVHADGVIMV